MRLFVLMTSMVLSLAPAAGAATRKLPGHMLPPAATEGAKPATPPMKTLALAVRLKMRNPGELATLVEHLYTPGDPLEGKFIAPEEFTARFGATSDEYKKVEDYFRGLNCTVLFEHPNRLLLDVQCGQAAVEQAFQVKISYLSTSSDETIRTIDADPAVPEGLPIEAVHGLTTESRRPRLLKRGETPLTPAGTGPNGGLSPSDIRSAYNLNGINLNGAGQTLALFELDGYNAADVSTYLSTFGMSAGIPLQNVLIDGFNGTAGPGADEVTLDIELMDAIAPGAKSLIVYEGPNTDAGVIDTYQKIANDNLAKQVSTSWGISEDQSPPAILNSENQIFMQLAAQGQALFAASGDSGANDNGFSLSVDDPAAQPFVSGAGGTTLTTGANQSYLRETTWFNGTNGGGGGVSTVWPIPSWQNGIIGAATLGSNSHRNVPDVALDSDPQTGYAIFVGGQWNTFGGTSCAAPLWAAFTSLVNQKRAAGGLAPLGFANPTIYQVGKSVNFSLDFHDVADGSTNGHYPAVRGYDLGTGWGSFNGANLIADLASPVLPSPSPTPSVTPSQSPSPSPSPSPPPHGGCTRSDQPMNKTDSTGAALSMGLPFFVGFVATRRKRRIR